MDSPPPPIDTLSPPAGVKRAGSIMISPRHLPTAAPSGGTGGGGLNMNALALASPSPEKLTKLEVFAPPEQEELKVFDKTLSSDVTQEEAIALLQKVDEQTALFREFSFTELAYLAQILTILKFAPGDTIIEAGEESSFVGMVLSGVLQVRFGEVVKPIPEGSLLGELSFFEGGVRTAAVSAQSDSIVAMITWNEMEQLASFAPTIRLKLMVLFALEGIKKMRQFNKPASSAPADDKAAADAAANAPYNQRQKRASVSTASTAAGAPAAATTEPTKVLSPSASGTSLVTSADVKSIKRGGSLLNGSLSIAPGVLNDKAAAPQQTQLQSRNVEALFRIRMKNEQKAQQEKIENALQKRKKAEHQAKTTTVIADAFKRELDKKQEFIEELYQENADLKEYKLWAQKKHISDARTFKDKVEQHQELTVRMAMESEKLRAQIKANEELYASLESMVAARTKSYNEQIASLQLEVRRGLTRIEASEKHRATLEENLKVLAHQKSVDDARAADDAKAAEEARLAAQILANEQIASAQRSWHVAQDELTVLRFRVQEHEEKHSVLSAWKDEAIETSLQREMLHQRLHRNLVHAVEKTSTIQKDLESFRTILKYVLVSVMVKNYRRKKYLASILAEQVIIMEKLQQQVHESAARASVSTAARPKLLLPENLVNSAQRGRNQQKRVMQSAGLEIDEDGRMLIKGSDDEYDAALSEYEQDGGGREQDRQSHLRDKLHRTRTDELFLRVNDLLPVMRNLVDEICSQKVYWNSTADSFFQRTIELKKICMDLEATTGLKINTSGAITGATSGTAGEHEAALDAHLNPRSNGGGGSNFTYQPDSKESDHSDRHFSSATSSSASKQAARNGRDNQNASEAEDDDEYSPATTTAAAASGSSSSTGGGTSKSSTVVVSKSHSSRESVADLRDTREKMVFYKRRCKDLKETNAMLSTRVRAFAERLAEMEEWQRNLYVHSNAAANAGFNHGAIGFQQTYPGLGFMSPLPPPQSHPLSLSSPLPPVVRAPPPGSSGASKTPRHAHQFSLGSYPPVSPAPPASSSATAAAAVASEPANNNPYFATSRPLVTPTKDAGGPVFQIKGSVAPSPPQQPPPPSQPMHALYTAMTSGASAPASAQPQSTVPQMNASGAFVIRPSEPQQPQPPHSYLQPNMHAHIRNTSAPPLLVFPPSTPPPNHACTARPAQAKYNGRAQQAR